MHGLSMRSRLVRPNFNLPQLSTAGITRLLTLLAVIGGVALGIPRPITPAQHAEQLLDQLRQVTTQELTTGQTIWTNQGIYFIGQSDTRVATAHHMAAKAFEATIARPASERQAAVEQIRRFADQLDLTASYQSTAFSAYNTMIRVEYYTSGANYYEIDTRTNQVTQFGPLPLPLGVASQTYDMTPRYTLTTLESMARDFIVRRTGINLSQLSPRHGFKEGIFFFRWELGGSATTHMSPFIQVGFSRGGELVSYANILNLRTDDSTLTGLTGTRVFSNGGSYYRRYGPAQYWYSRSGEGYCGHMPGANCGPTTVEYTYSGSTLSNYAVWDNPDSAQWAAHDVFIPRVNATSTRAPYTLTYNGASGYSFTINQNAFYDQWVRTTPADPWWWNVMNTWLSDVSNESGTQIGFDEILITYK